MFKKKHLLVLASLILAFGILVGCSTDDTEPGMNNEIEAPVLNPETDTDAGTDTDADTDADTDTDADEEEDTDSTKNNG